MIYLLSQMFLVTVVAVIVGVAFGWLIHRTMHAGKVHQLQQTVRRQRAQVSQAKSDVAMLNDDYDELKRSSHDQIITLQTANQQIPELLTNLEKSQLLAQQNMKRHESRERNLSVENKRLEEQLAELKSNAAAPAKAANSRFIKEPSAFALKSRSQDSKREIAADDAMKAKTRSQLASSELVTNAPLASTPLKASGVAQVPDMPLGPTLDGDDTLKESSMDMTLASSESPADGSDTVNELEGSSLDMTQAAPVFSASDFDDKDLFEESSLDMTQSAPVFAIAEADNDPFDQVMEVGDDFQMDFDQTNDTASQAPLDETAKTSVQRNNASTLDMLDIGAETEEEELSRVKNELAAERARFSNPDLNPLQSDSDPDLQPHSQTRFTPSKTADDLQQIFGIGPLTEKALNELGITSYSQLAQLEKHDIQHIADALEIGPGRIERDNWVGNARSQLEDVLEEL